MRRALVAAGVAVALLAAVPGTASADVIFDQADAEELAETLAEAYRAQGVCYGWHVDVVNVGRPETSDGSNFGAGTRLADAPEFATNCDTSIEFQANIQWTSESSELEDSASYQVLSSPDGPTTSDLDSLEIISTDGLAGDNVDVDVYKAVAALPLLAADAGVAEPLEATPAPDTAAADAGGAPTNSPGPDFLRESGGALLFGALLLVAGGLFAWWSVRSGRRSVRRRAAAAPVEPGMTGPAPDHVPPDWYNPPTGPGPHGPQSPPGGPTGKPATPPPDPETRPGE